MSSRWFSHSQQSVAYGGFARIGHHKKVLFSIDKGSGTLAAVRKQPDNSLNLRVRLK